MSGVLDASAILAILFEEPGAEIVRGVVAGSLVSAVNYSEAISKALDRQRDFNDTIGLLAHMGFILVSHDRSLAMRAGQLRLSTKRFGLSLGDRACLALAEQEQLPVYTTDRNWARLDLGIQVQVIR